MAAKKTAAQLAEMAINVAQNYVSTNWTLKG